MLVLIRYLMPSDHFPLTQNGLISVPLKQCVVALLKDGSVWRTNKFTDVPQFPMDTSPDMRLWERRMLYCIPVSSL